jgi:integrase
VDKYISSNKSVEAEALRPDTGRAEYRTSVRGLRLRVTSTNTREFLWYYSHPYRLDENGKRRRCVMSLGKYSKDFTWGSACDALEAAKEKVKEGLDPNPQPTEAIASVPETVSELCDRFYEMRILPVRAQPAPVAQLIRTHIKPAIGGVRLELVTQDHMLAPALTLYQSGKHAHAKNCFKLLAQMCRWAKVKGYWPVNPLSDVKLLDAGMDISGGMRQRVLSKREIKLFYRTMNDSRIHTAKKLALRLLLLTGCRTQEIRLNKWKNYDPVRATLTVPYALLKTRRKMKTKDDFVIPLAPASVAILNRLKEITGSTGFIMGDPTTGKCMGPPTLRNSMYTVSERCNISDITVHDLRRTCRTQLSKCGVQSDLAERYIGHAVGTIEQTYNLNKYLKKRRRAAEKLADRLLPLMGPGPENDCRTDDKVVAFTRAA